MRSTIRIPAKIIIWVVFWTMAYFVLLNIFASSGEWQKIDHIYTGIFIATLIGAVGVNEYSRRLLNAKRYVLWLLAVAGIGCAFAAANYFIFDKLIDYVLPGYYFISYYSYFDLLKFFGSFLALTTLMTLSIEWFQLEEEKAKAEFKALANQVNPHFLFNSLTVLYSLSLKDHRDTSSAIIKLSDILRYVIYQSSENTVSLASEAAILRDYIDLQRYRVHPTTHIEFTEHLDSDAPVAPMLFLPLVENAFKHGVHGETQNAFVKMTLRKEGGVVSFMISNNKSKVAGEAGIGLKNLRKRLALQYPAGHSFVIEESENEFKVSMRISLWLK
jgi:sensor histidine kinase YesM